MTLERRLYFLRHGRADRDQFHGADDRQRPLVAEGRQCVRDSARFMGDLGLTDLDVIVTSPLARALQTAEIAAVQLGLGDHLVVDKRLGLEFSGRLLPMILADLPETARQIMLVGHEPGFSMVIGQLTGGEVIMRKGALARVDLAAGSVFQGSLVWLLQPRVLLSGARAWPGPG